MDTSGLMQAHAASKGVMIAPRRRRLRRYVATPLAMVMVLTLAEQPAVAQTDEEWEPPAPPEVEGVEVVEIPPLPRPDYEAAGPVVTSAPSVSWPRGGTEVISLPDLPATFAGPATADGAPQPGLAGRVSAGTLPVRVGAAPLDPQQAELAAAGMSDVVQRPARVAVHVADRATASSAGVHGLLVGVSRADGVRQAVPVAVEIDYSGFRHAYGAQWASRLQVTMQPRCHDSEPAAACAPSQRLATVNDHQAGVLTATVPLAGDGGFTMLTVSADPAGDGGDYTATDLTPASTWQVSAQTGALAWGYPLRMVPGVGGPEPNLALSYSSQAVDGRTVNTNSQGSWIGDGWSLWPGIVERTYQSCASDTDPVGGNQPNNHDNPTGDLCWVSDNATISLNGRATELVKGSDGKWRGMADDGSRIEQKFDTSLGNGTYNGEYWKVTGTDGTQYYFGRHRRQDFPTDTAATNSTWTVPVYGNHPGEPCHQAGNFSASRCTQAWRWNLDYIVDPHGNTMTLFYSRETGAYAREMDADKRTTYHRGGYLQRIEYGTRAGSEHTTTVPARVRFDTADRCLPEETCTQANPQAWPDTPWDLYCDAAPCTGVWSPTFWTQKRLDRIRTQVWRDGSFSTVESWQLRHQYLDAGAADGEGIPMWLAGITRTGHVTTAGGQQVSDPEIVFDPGSLPLANRVDGPDDGKTSINRWRLKRVWTESGALITVSYSPTECTLNDAPTPHTNTKRCFPQWYGLGEEPTLDWFHKYVVTSIQVDDLTGASPPMQTHYDHLDDPAWAYTDSELIPEDKRTWAAWRGYSQVRIRQGLDQEPQTATEYLYMRGMHGDRAGPTGGTRNVQITDSQNVSIDDHEAHAGFLREQTVLDGPGGQWISGTIYTPWRHGPTAESGPLRAYLTNSETIRSRTRLEGGTTRWTRTTTSFDTTYGMPTQIDDRGDESKASDEICIRFGYARNTVTWLVDKVSRVEKVSRRCSQDPQRPDDVLTDNRTFYDDADTYGAPPTRGLPVKVQEVDSWDESTPVWVTTTRSTFDNHGRPLDTFDALDRQVSTSYTPAVGGPVTATAVTDALGHTATSVVEPAWSSALSVADANGRVTELTYDGLGRLTAVWLPGRDSVTESASMEFEYALRDDAPSVVTSRSLLPDGDHFTRVIILDGLLRERQTQVQAVGGGRSITDTFYDSRGLTEWASTPYYDTSNSPPSEALVAGGPQIPGIVEYVYDGAGRPIHEIFLANGQEAWRSTYAYGGDRVHLTPPAGGTATTTITDARGQMVAMRQYQGPSPTGAYDETVYTYTARGELATVTDPASNIWSYEYDQRGRQVVAQDPDAGLTSKTYDLAGQLQTTTDARGVTLGFTYDNLGRQTSVRDDSPVGAMRAQWIYDTLPGGLGELTRSIRHHGGAQYVNEVLGYDQAGRPTGQRVTIPETETGLHGVYDTSVTYRPDGSLGSTTLPAAGDLDAEQLIFLYNDVGQPAAFTSGMSIYLYEATYNKLGDLTQRVLGNHGNRTAVTYQYDEPTGRLARISAVPELKAEVLDLAYSYDDAGNLTRVADSPNLSSPNDTQCFRYDHLRRLTDAWTPSSPLPTNCNAAPHLPPIGGIAPYRLAYTYDAVGNRLTEDRYSGGSSGGAWMKTTTYSHPPAGAPQPHAVSEAQIDATSGSQSNSYSYDAAGRMSERALGEATQTISWTPEGRVDVIEDDTDGVVEFIYNADGERLVRRDASGKTLYLGSQEIRYNSTTGTLSCTRYYYHLDTQIGVRTSDGLTWMVTDHHNTATVAIRATDLSSQRKRHLPFGEARGDEPIWWPGDKGFLGGTEDPTGLTHLGARLYDSTLGRFISVDPVMDLVDPQHMHGYSYANNNPLTWSDPTGLCPNCGVWLVDDRQIGGTISGPTGTSTTTTTAGGNEEKLARINTTPGTVLAPPPPAPPIAPPPVVPPKPFQITPRTPAGTGIPPWARALGLAGSLLMVLSLAGDSPPDDFERARQKEREDEESCSQRTGSLPQHSYMTVDALGRARGATACLTPSTVALDERKRPTPVGFEDGMHRSHLISRALGGKNGDESDLENIVPLWPSANYAMKPVESEVRRRLNNNERVFYSVIPLYAPGQLAPYAVLMYVNSASGEYTEIIENKR
jgi:RHS repeat-associated protein